MAHSFSPKSFCFCFFVGMDSKKNLSGIQQLRYRQVCNSEKVLLLFNWRSSSSSSGGVVVTKKKAPLTQEQTGGSTCSLNYRVFDDDQLDIQQGRKRSWPTSFNHWRDNEDYMDKSPTCPPSSFKSPLSPFDIFINHRGKDTKRKLATLLHGHLVHLNLNPFLDYKSMKLGDELNEAIESAIRECKVGVAIFSTNYCTSDNCLHELALMLECKKKIIPIFYDVKISDLVLVNDGKFPPNQLHRFNVALEIAKGRVGISFDSSEGDWSALLNTVSNRVVEILMELEVEEKN